MAQYQTGTVSTVSGSVTVNGLGTAWLTEVQSNDEFILEDSLGGGAFVVASVIDDTTLTLTAPFPLTLNNQNYTIARDFSAKLNFGLIYKNDVEHATIDRRNWLILDNLVGSPAGTIIQIDGATVFTDLNDTPSSYVGQELKLVRVADGSPSTDLEFVSVSDLLGGVTLDQIGDVQGSPNPEDGQFLQYDTATSEWIYVDIAPGAGATELDELTDVSVSGETDGDILVYSGSDFINTKTVSSVLTYGSPYTISNSGDLVHKQYVDNAVATAGDSTGSPIGSLVDHQDLIGAGTTTHSAIDSHISDSSIHFTQGAISITESQISDLQSYLLNINSESIFDLSDVSGSPIPNVGQVLKWDGSKFAAESDIIGSPTGSGVTDHTLLTNIGTNTHAQLDTHVADSTIHFTEGSIDHTAISNIGSNSHSTIDTHIADSTIHFTAGSISLDDLSGVSIGSPALSDVLTWNGSAWTPQPAAGGGGDSVGSPLGSFIDHQDLIGAGTNDHSAIDSHISDSSIHFTHPDPHRLGDGGLTAPAYSFASDTDTGMYYGSGNLTLVREGSGAFTTINIQSDRVNFNSRVTSTASSSLAISIPQFCSGSDIDTGISFPGNFLPDNMLIMTGGIARLRLDEGGLLSVMHQTGALVDPLSGSPSIDQGSGSPPYEDRIFKGTHIPNKAYVDNEIAAITGTYLSDITGENLEDLANVTDGSPTADDLDVLTFNASKNKWEPYSFGGDVYALLDGSNQPFSGDLTIDSASSYAVLTLDGTAGGRLEFDDDGVYKARIEGSSTGITFEAPGTILRLWSAGVLQVYASNYETLVTNDDHIPNKKYVDDAIDTDIAAINIEDLANTSAGSPAASVGDVLTWDGSQWEPQTPAGGGGGISNVVEDTTPQLGGDLDVNSNDIVSVSNGDINITPDGTGHAVISGCDLRHHVNTQSGTTYTLVIGDAGYVECSNASAIILTVPPNSSVAFGIGTEVHIVQTGAGQVTIAEGSGVTINHANDYGSPLLPLKTRTRYSAITVRKTATDTWHAFGDLVNE